LGGYTGTSEELRLDTLASKQAGETSSSGKNLSRHSTSTISMSELAVCQSSKNVFLSYHDRSKDFEHMF
jgi:hypothetical protein